MNENKILWNKLEKIHETLLNNYKQETHIGGLLGVSGLALFEFYYAQLKDDDQYAEIGLEMLSHCMEKINNGYSVPAFGYGISGMGWIMDHLSIEGFLEDSNDELLSNFDEFLFEAMIQDLNNNNIDYIHGAIGYGLYFLNRHENSANIDLKIQYMHKLKILLSELEKLAEHNGDEITWKINSILHERPPYYDFSHAHGLSGIANFLCRLTNYNELKSKATYLLEGTLKYILKYKTNDSNSHSLFPSQIHNEKEVKYWSRVGWCYGDLGPAMLFSRAGKLLQRKDLNALSDELFSHEAVKRDPKITHTYDSAFCHGSFGNAYIFNRAYQQSQKLIYKESSDFWFTDGLKKGNHENTPTGFIQRDGINKNWVDVNSLLEGVAGIGLVMIDTLSDKKLNWDKILMIS